MKSKSCNRAFAILLSLVLIIALLPTTVFAAGSTTITKKNELSAALADSDITEIHIAGNMTVYTGDLNTDKTIVIDPSYTLTVSSASDFQTGNLIISDGATLKVVATSVSWPAHVYGTVENNGTILLTKEIEFQTLEVELCEKRIREYTASVEAKQEEIVKNTEALEERKKDLEMKKNELDEIISETKQEEERLRDKTKALEATIEPRLLQAFKRIRKNSRNGLGITYVQRDACGGCFNKIPPQKQLDIRMRKKIIVCEYCGRIMIDPELAGVVPEKHLETKIK